MNYRPLEKEVKKHNRIMRQVWRNDDTAIYEYFGGYEVIVIKKREAEHAFGKDYPPRETCPSDEDWGTYAITRPASDDLDYLKQRARELFSATRTQATPQTQPLP